MLNLSVLIGAREPAKPILPSAHTTDGYSFREILREKVIKPSVCKPYEEPITYFFYGRPAYRVFNDFGPTSLSCFSAICFLIETESLPQPKRVFPFDTGAWAKGCYDDFLHPQMRPLHFEVKADHQEAAKLVGYFFGTNFQYYIGKCLQDVKIPPFEMEAECLKAMLSMPGRTDSDDRRGSIEIQFEGPVELKKARVVAIVLPSYFMDDEHIRRLCGELGEVELVPYDCYHARPAEDTRAIMDAAGVFLKKRGYI